MKLKTVLFDGVSYAVLDAAGLPVYVHDDNKEVGFDAPSASSRITALNAESAGRRTELAEAQAQLKKFEGIEDPEKAKAAVATVANLAAGDLVQAGKVDEINYARHQEYGAQGRAGRRFVGLAAQQWLRIVEEVAKEAQSRAGG